MTFYEYYRYQTAQRLTALREAFAIKYLYGHVQKPGDMPPEKSRLPMRTLREIILQEQAVKDARPEMALYPRNFAYAGEAAEGARTISRFLTGVGGDVSTFRNAMETIYSAIDNER